MEHVSELTFVEYVQCEETCVKKEMTKHLERMQSNCLLVSFSTTRNTDLQTERYKSLEGIRQSVNNCFLKKSGKGTTRLCLSDKLKTRFELEE
jgi:hypothetical protein